MKYKVTLTAEEEMSGIVELTEEQYEAVKFATNCLNWENVSGGGYCGSFYIEPIDESEE